jgi:3'-phosphoadenosine 5'-phosphosulfate sulfotransferase (PAPS reductase)/FAD synthetase
MLASLIFVLSIPAEQRKKPISVLCTDTRVEIPAIAEMIEGTLDRMRKCSEQNNLNIDANHVAPTFRSARAGLKAGVTAEESFWVNIIGRGYPPPNRTFRWCTQRMKIDPVNALVKQRVGHWGEAILHLGSRRAESSTRAQTMAARETRNGLRRHPDLPRVWVSNPIEFLSTEEVWAYLLQNPNPRGNRPRTDTPWRAPTPAPRTVRAPSRRSSCTRCVRVVVRGELAMTIQLKPEQEHRIAEALRSGAYQSPDDVIERALEVLHERDEWLMANRQTVDAKIRTGIEELNRGEGIPEDKLDEHLDRLK